MSRSKMGTPSAVGPSEGLRIMPLAFVAVRRGPPPALRESGTRSPAGRAPRHVHPALLGGFQCRMPTSAGVDVRRRPRSSVHDPPQTAPSHPRLWWPGRARGACAASPVSMRVPGQAVPLSIQWGQVCQSRSWRHGCEPWGRALRLPSLPVVGTHGGIPHSMIASGRSSRTARSRTHSKTSSLRFAPMRRCGIAASGPELPSSHASVASVAFASSSGRGAR